NKGGWPALEFACAIPTEGAPSLRSLQGWVAMLPTRSFSDKPRCPCGRSSLPRKRGEWVRHRRGVGTRTGVSAPHILQVPGGRQQPKRDGAVESHPNVAKSATLGWGTRLLHLIQRENSLTRRGPDKHAGVLRLRMDSTS